MNLRITGENFGNFLCSAICHKDDSSCLSGAHAQVTKKVLPQT